MTVALSIHLAVTWMLVGLIWIIQVLTYPQFLRVGESDFRRYHFAHCVRIGLLVVPLLVIEAGTAAWLLFQGHRGAALLASISLIPVGWLITFAFQAPLHVQLMRGFKMQTVRRLMLTNWLRTVAWTTRAVLLAFAIIQ